MKMVQAGNAEQTASNAANTALPEHVNQHIETIAALHARAESQINFHQRTIETVTANLGRPLFLNLVLLFVGGWVLVNVFPQRFGLQRFDVPPFFWLDSLISLGALLLTIIVLITQNRQARLAERRAELDLQVNLLAEQKVAKLIGLVEELRRDLPSVKNRVDPEAEAMQEAADPHAVLAALEEKLDEAQEFMEQTESPGH